jgi:hypothetical protein
MSLGPCEWEVGRHSLRFEPPDILWVKYRGALCLQEAVRMVEVSRDLGRSGRIFMVGDMSEAGLPDTEAGRYFSEHLRFEWYLGAIYIGARLVQRAMAKGIFLASYLTEHTTDARVLELTHFVATKEEAAALMSQVRTNAAAMTPEVTEWRRVPS